MVLRGCGDGSGDIVLLDSRLSEWREMSTAWPHLGGMKMSCIGNRLHNTPMSEPFENGLTFDIRRCKGPSKLRGLELEVALNPI